MYTYIYTFTYIYIWDMLDSFKGGRQLRSWCVWRWEGKELFDIYSMWLRYAHWQCVWHVSHTCFRCICLRGVFLSHVGRTCTYAFEMCVYISYVHVRVRFVYMYIHVRTKQDWAEFAICSIHYYIRSGYRWFAVIRKPVSHVTAHHLYPLLINSRYAQSLRCVWAFENGKIALLLTTNSLMCSKYVSQKRKEAIDNCQWYNMLLNFIL